MVLSSLMLVQSPILVRFPLAADRCYAKINKYKFRLTMHSDLYQILSHPGRTAAVQCPQEVLIENGHRLQNDVIHFALLAQVNHPHNVSNAFQSSLCAEGSQICPYIPMGALPRKTQTKSADIDDGTRLLKNHKVLFEKRMKIVYTRVAAGIFLVVHFW